jgi:hydroxymethylpyrimidine pyrophosphatase-like HAD family hydrolase
MTYVFDIDGTICTKTEGTYELAEPFYDRIKKINELYDAGHKIIFNTARGMGRNENSSKTAIQMFFDITYKQLEEWNVKYHSLFLGKPAGDIYIDDKGVSDENFFTN